VLVGRPTHTSQVRGARNEPGGNCRDVGMTEMDRQTDPRGVSTTAGVDVSADREPTAAEVPEWRRDDVPKRALDMFGLPLLRGGQ
jgi:hypothetical protein